MTETSVTLVEGFVEMGLIEARGSMLRSRDIEPISQIQCLRRDLGLNLVGATMVLDMACGNCTVEGTPVTAFIGKLQREEKSVCRVHRVLKLACN